MSSLRTLTPRLLRVPLATAAVLSVALLCLFPLSRAQAAFHLCRSDPIVTLSNGDVVTIYVEIAAEADDVKNIDYVLHVPKDVTATNIIYLGAELGLVENLTLKQDGKPKEYKAETTVYTSGKVDVTTTVVFEDNTKTVEGASNKAIKVTVKTE